MALTWRGELAPGETVVVLGAGGVVGQAAVQLARLYGAARVVARPARTTASSGPWPRVRTRWSPSTPTTWPSWPHRFGAAVDGPVDLVLDPLFGVPAAAAAKCLRPGGRLVNLGGSADEHAPLDSSTIRSRSLRVLGYTNNELTREQKAGRDDRGRAARRGRAPLGRPRGGRRSRTRPTRGSARPRAGPPAGWCSFPDRRRRWGVTRSRSQVQVPVASVPAQSAARRPSTRLSGTAAALGSHARRQRAGHRWRPSGGAHDSADGHPGLVAAGRRLRVRSTEDEGRALGAGTHRPAGRGRVEEPPPPRGARLVSDSTASATTNAVVPSTSTSRPAGRPQRRRTTRSSRLRSSLRPLADQR